MTGQTISHFEVLEKLGQGGMGVVYKARDTQLNRLVALKVLPAELVSDPERRRRFVQEAKAASALNHPNIITVYEISSYEGGEFIAMEFVRGKTLDAFISRKGLDLDQALKYAVQIAEALATAQANGIIHRDVKPANIMVTDSGLVKVLDFGLAKLTEAPATDADAARTVDEILRTTEGTIAGTAAYMSPEQAEGKPVDSRTDIFSFGAVLYEMVTGQRPFQGSSQLSILTSVLRDDPQPMAAIAGNVPPELERIIARCLRKDPNRRWHSMKDVQVALTELREEADASTRFTPRPALVASSGPKTSVPEPAGKIGTSGKPLLKEALIAGGVLLAVVAAVIVWHGRADKPAATAPAIQSPRVVTPQPNKPSPLGEPLLTNDGIVELVKGGVPANLIIGQIASSKTNFDLSPPQLVRLVNERVPDNVIEAMRNPQSASGASQADSASPAGMTTLTIPEGQKILMKLQQTVSVSTAHKDDSISFAVAAPVRVAGKVVIAAGAIATGVVAGVEKKRLKWIGGNKLVLQLGSVPAVDGQPVRLRANAPVGHRTNQIVIGKGNPDSGESGAKSKEFAALAGTSFTAYVDADRLITVPQSKPSMPSAPSIAQ